MTQIGATSFIQNLECTTPCLYNISFIQHLICTKLGYTTPHLYKTHFYNTSFVQHLGYTTLGYTTLESTILINVSLPDISLLKLFPLGRLRPTLAVLQNGSIQQYLGLNSDLSEQNGPNLGCCDWVPSAHGNRVPMTTECPGGPVPQGGRKLLLPVRWSLKRKFGLTKDFKMGLG